MHLKTFFRAGLLSLSLGALLGGTVAASDETTIKIVTDGQAEVLVLRDLDQTLPIGETRQFSAESGKLAIVGRSEEGLLIDIDGELTDIKLLPASATTVDSGAQDVSVWVHGADGDAEVVQIDKRVAIVHAGDADVSAHGDEGKRVIMIKSHADHALAHGHAADGDDKHVVVIKSPEDEAEIAAALAAAGVDSDTQDRILVKIDTAAAGGSGKQVFVTRRVTE